MTTQSISEQILRYILKTIKKCLKYREIIKQYHFDFFTLRLPKLKINFSLPLSVQQHCGNRWSERQILPGMSACLLLLFCPSDSIIKASRPLFSAWTARTPPRVVTRKQTLLTQFNYSQRQWWSQDPDLTLNIKQSCNTKLFKQSKSKQNVLKMLFPSCH